MVTAVRVAPALVLGTALASFAPALLAQAPPPQPAAPSVANPWVQLAAFPDPSEELLGAAATGKLYVVGGTTTLPATTETGIHPARPNAGLATVQEYDPATNAWRERRPMLTARNHHAVASVADKIYVIGGRIGSAFITGT